MEKGKVRHGIWIAAGIWLCSSFPAWGDAVQERALRTSGVIQVTAVKGEDLDGFVFGLDRVRLVARGSVTERVGYKLQVDFGKQNVPVDKDGETPGLIKDAEIRFDLGRNRSFSVGKFKTPVGMEFNTSGSKLDFVKRGLGQRLVFERNAGLMLSFRKIGAAGLGLDLGIFNAGPNRANGVGDPAEGQDYTLAGRAAVDPDPRLHAELFWGAALTSVEGQDDVLLVGGGARFTPVKGLSCKGEVIFRDDGNDPGADGTDYYLQAGYLFTPRIEPVVKFERLDLQAGGEDRTDLTAGVNLFLEPGAPHQARVQINHVVSDQDGKGAFQVMFQAAF